MTKSPFQQQPLLAGEEILALIPQRAPIVMVDRFYGIDAEGSYTGLQIEASNMFCNEGLFDECGITEHIAQSAAARIGYIYIQKGEAVPIGFIGSIDKMHYHVKAKEGDLLQTTIRIEQEVFDITMISAQVHVAEELIAEGQMKIFLKHEDNETK
ncbi:hydroxymyristoyl-ACP dehydratase [Parabacteroides sp. OttesenSCG-928-G06]|nr:hydroxymyristoyl-ACP dehydratase [Parabacteroides sp. OttesenSCG-928-K15]MDL2282834.1 hydroxymyristoyl-ACP dehydratase [Parabacteroides sp. OttesenSCG-928-G06]